jgi:general secretion pathway protein G
MTPWTKDPNQRRLARHARRGFTLLEIVVVVTIIALIAALVAPRLLGTLSGAKRRAALAEAESIKSQIKLYLVDIGRSVPPDDLTLDVLLLRSDEGGGANGPYLESTDDLLDPWDHRYELRVPGTNGADFDVVSYGEDGQQGGEGPNADIIG